MAELRPYESPTMEPLTFTAVSKHLTADVATEGRFDGGYEPAELLARFGSPLFVVSETMLRRRFRGFLEVFSEPGLETRVAYSYKTNYLPAVCAILREEGAWADIVSGMEYHLARAIGVPPAEILFNGPYKSREELETALAEGAVVTIDNFDELALVERVASTLERESRIGIRVNFRYGAAPWTKFGFSDNNGESQLALTRIAANPKLKLELLHNHSGTFLLNPEIYAKATDVLVGVAQRARALGLSPTMVDLGGGYPSENSLKPEFDGTSGTRRDTHALFPYAEAICGRLMRAKELFGGTPTLVLEPGRAIVDAAVHLVCSVVATKTIAEQGKAVILDAGVNLVPTAYWYDHKVSPAADGGNGGLETVKIFGPLCMQIDVLRERAVLPPLKIGDPLVISNVGAYCHTQSMQFIQPRPATVLLGRDGPEIIRRQETWRDIFLRDRIPDRFKADGFSF